MKQQASSGFQPSISDGNDEIAIVVLGGGGHASDVMSIIEALHLDDNHQILIADDSPTKDRFVDRNTSIVSPIRDHLKPGRQFVSGVGYPGARKKLVELADAAGLKPVDPLIHPTAVIATGASIEEGAVIGALSYVSALATIGAHCYVGYGTKIGHDTTVDKRTSLMPGAFVAGDARVGKDVLIGANATILQGLSIGDGATVGAGSVVTKDVPAGATATGIPATTPNGAR